MAMDMVEYKRALMGYLDIHVWTCAITSNREHIVIVHKVPGELAVVTWLDVTTTIKPSAALTLAWRLGEYAGSDPTPRRIYHHLRNGEIVSWTPGKEYLRQRVRSADGQGQAVMSV